jgi:acetolactate decarboxylase
MVQHDESNTNNQPAYENQMTEKSIRLTVISAVLAFLPTGCSSANTSSPKPALPSAQSAGKPLLQVAINVHGALREIMHMGRTERQVDLAPLIGQKGAYGLGALEGLGGEVTLWNGELWLSTPGPGNSAVAGQQTQTAAGATLLVTANVTNWQQIPIASAVAFRDLDAFIERAATAAGIDTTEAFPFRIEGTPSTLDWHVINGAKIPKDSHGHEAHMKTAVRGSITGKAVRILGFFSPKHHAVFTHHDTNTHAHVIAEQPAVTGHVDHVDLAAGNQLWLPAR